MVFPQRFTASVFLTFLRRLLRHARRTRLPDRGRAPRAWGCPH